MNMSMENFLYEFINFWYFDYSYEKIGVKIWVKWFFNSDFIELGYEIEDFGICQNILCILVEVFIVFNIEIKVNNLDEVVKYFQV